jgi:CBS domain containing-hemolysin-like protein
MEYVFKISITLALIALNAFFVAAEFAAVAARKTRLIEESKRNLFAKFALTVKNRLDLYLSTCQFGITLASLGLGFVAEDMLVGIFEPIFENYDFISNTHGVAVVLALSICTALHVSIGEVAPKNAAIRLADTLLPFLALPLMMFTYAFYPAIWILNECGNLVLKLFGLEAPEGSHEEHRHSLSEIRSILEHSIEGEKEGESKTEILASAFKFDERTAKHIMTPRTEVDYLLLNDNTEDLLEKIRNSRYTRFPLCDKQVDNIIGLVHMKDILNLLLSEQKKVQSTLINNIYPVLDLKSISREINVIPDSIHLTSLLKKFQNSKIHMAVVFNEHGSLTGIVTLEDVIEELVGEIDDEFDQSSTPLIQIEDYGLRTNTRVPLYQLAEVLKIDELKENRSVTLNGYLLEKLDRLPALGDVVNSAGYEFKIATVEENGSLEVQIRKIEGVEDVVGV